MTAGRRPAVFDVKDRQIGLPHGWQQAATDAVHTHVVGTSVRPRLNPTEQAAVQTGPIVGSTIPVLPFQRGVSIRFVLVPHLALPPSLDPPLHASVGVAWPSLRRPGPPLCSSCRGGVWGRLEYALQLAAARICPRGKGQRGHRHYGPRRGFVAFRTIGAVPKWWRTVFRCSGARLAIDSTLVSLLGQLTARWCPFWVVIAFHILGASREDGAALAAARRRKERTYGLRRRRPSWDSSPKPKPGLKRSFNRPGQGQRGSCD